MDSEEYPGRDFVAWFDEQVTPSSVPFMMDGQPTRLTRRGKTLLSAFEIFVAMFAAVLGTVALFLVVAAWFEVL